MDEVDRVRALPARITGEPAAWARDAAIVGGITGYVGPATALFGWSLHPWLLACAAACALGGAVLGASVALALERARGVVPLRVLAVALPALAIGLGALWAGSAAWLVGAPILAAATFGGVAAAVQVGLAWLPYTVQAVLGGPRWPIVVVASALSPLIGLLAWAVFVVL